MKNSEKKDFYKKIWSQKFKIESATPSDFKEILKGDVLSLNDLKMALETTAITEESLKEKSERLTSFYKENQLWGSFDQTIPHTHQLVIPFPDLLGVSENDLCRKIFKEETRLLRRTVSEKIKTLNFSCLNWWYFIKTIYPEIDNQVLIQYQPSSSFSFDFDNTFSLETEFRARFNPQILSRTFIKGFYQGFQPDKTMNPLLLNKFKSLFDVWPLKKRLRVLSQISFPFSSETSDILNMFFIIPEDHWHCKDQNPSLFKQILGTTNLKDLHDLLMFLSRKITLPLKNLDQSQILFLKNKKFKNYTFKVPQSNHDLDSISRKLNNCVGRGGYFEKVESKSSFIVEVLKDGESFACVEYSIPSKKIVQSKIKQNRPLDDSSLTMFLEIEISNVIKFNLWKAFLKFLKIKS